MIVHEAVRFGGLGGEIAAQIQEEAFDELDAPITRVTTIDAPAIYSPPVETEQLPNVDRVVTAARAALKA